MSMAELFNSLPVWQRGGLVVLLGVVVYLVTRFGVLRLLDRMASSTENDLDDRLVLFARRFLGFAVVFAVVLGVLKVFEIEISPLLASAGIAGIALGLAAKETLADILAGIFLIADRPIGVGDRVKIESIGRDWGSWGDVLDIGLRRTKVRNTDGVVVNYPNSVLASSVITNFSDEAGPTRVRIRLQLDYDADVAKAREVTRATIKVIDGIDADSVELLVRALWDQTGGHMHAGVLVEIRYLIAEVRQRTPIRSRVLEALLLAYREAGIPLARPHLSVADEHYGEV
jgi:small-conductance mechanosensitive channel